MKICNACGLEKNLSEFGKNSSRKDGLMGMCKGCNSKRMQKWYAENPEKRKRHGLTQTDFTNLLESQGGKCGACDNTEGPWRIDHDHSCCDKKYGCSNCVRGILCNGCNVALAMVNDDINRLRGLIDYLDGMVNG